MTLSSHPTPAGLFSGEPFLSASEELVYMSWLERTDESDPALGHDLKLSTWDGSDWSEPVTVQQSDAFFVNWADFPSVRPGPGRTLWAHWLERGAAGGYDYGVRVVHSRDGGATWSTPWTPHDDDSPTEHGFVSMVSDAERVGLVWLDGRNFVDGPDGTTATREMTLRYRTAGADVEPGAETLLDGRVCDCCQTSAAMTSSGPLVVYRDRSPDEIRDIYVARMVDGHWTEGTAVHDDGWYIEGCPVNGPSVAASGDDVAVAWFTGAADTARVKIAFSGDAGATFSPPVVVDDGDPSGRVDVSLRSDGSALVTWLERVPVEDDPESTRAEVRLRRVHPGGTASESRVLSASTADRASGFPRLVETPDGSYLLAWTDASQEWARVHVTQFTLEDEDGS
ncbi:MAG: sialidase family protein [Gemmatimonadota bacterium]